MSEKSEIETEWLDWETEELLPHYSDCDICGLHPGARVIWSLGTETVACAHCLERGAP